MGYNEIIFNTLAARKSINIEGIGVVVVVAHGTLRVNPKSVSDFPHYELRLIKNSHYDVSLKNSLAGDYDAWLSTLKAKGKIISIEGCLSIKMNGDEVVSITPSDELFQLLNPFYTIKKKYTFPFVAFFSVLVIICGLVYILLPEVPDPKPEPKKEAVVMVVKPTPVPIVLDTIVAVDTVKKVELPKVSESGYTEQIKDNSYLVVGSFRTLEEARSDAKRLEKLYPELSISTTKKMRGEYFNYIYTSSSFEDADAKKSELYNKFEKIKGIWVYRMR